jgi:hypothetical protein
MLVQLLFKGVNESQLDKWSNSGIMHAELGLDWRKNVGWTPEFDDDKLFRAIEYGAMCVYRCGPSKCKTLTASHRREVFS